MKDFEINIPPRCGKTPLHIDKFLFRMKNGWMCKNCKWHDDFTWVCFNGESANRAGITDENDSCECWEEKE